MERDYTLYQHFCKVTKKSYIGITKQKPQNRWKNGCGYDKGTHFGKAINKYGWNNFEHIILATNLTEEEAKQLEQTCIVVFETYGKDGYNSTFGGDGTLGMSEESRKRQSEKLKGHIVSQETREKISKTNKGRIISQEQREKISKANKGREFSEEHRKKIGEANKSRIITKETREKISKGNKGKKSWNKGKTNVYSEESKRKMSESHKRKKVGQYTLDGKLINIYESINATKKYGYNPQTVSGCCNGRYKTHMGYIWKFI
jgi:group I intron endonuclease